MVYRKAILTVTTGLVLLVFGCFVATMGFVNRLSAKVRIQFNAHHMTYVTLGLCFLANGVFLLLYGCRLHCKIWKSEKEEKFCMDKQATMCNYYYILSTLDRESCV